MPAKQQLERVFSAASKLLRKPVEWLFHYEYDDLSDIPRPYFLLANHNMDVDPILVGLAIKKQAYFVATENVLRKRFFAWFLTSHFDPIIHVKGKAGTKTVMTLLRTLRRGDSAVLFAEGNRSFDGVTGEIPPATTKLARKSGAALVTFRIEGGYLCQPRWGTTLRRGKLRGRLMHVYTPEEMQAMTEEELYASVSGDLYEDAWERQKNEHTAFRGKKPALGLESTLFACPKCRKFGTLKSTASGLGCECGFSASYDEYGYLTEPDGAVHTVRELNLNQQALLRERQHSSVPGTLLFGDPVRISLVNERHRTEHPREVLLSAVPEGFLISGKTVSPAEIAGAAIFSRNVLSVHLEDGKQYEIRGEKHFNALKYLCLLKLLKADAD